jgi:hypothetical protein
MVTTRELRKVGLEKWRDLFPDKHYRFIVKDDIGYISDDAVEMLLIGAKKEEAIQIFANIDKLKIRRGSHSMIDEEDYQQLKEQFLNEK